jgi:predicted nucleotidyltransferase
MNPLALLESKSDDIAALCRRYGVLRLRVFGSAVRSDWDAESSDFDFLAEFGPTPPGVNRFDQHFGLLVELERLLGRTVDVVETKTLKWVIKDRVLEEAQLVYAA